HALLFSDLALRSEESDFGLLPRYRVVILDEAHTVEDIAARHLGLQVSSTMVENLLNRLFSPRTQRGLLSFHGTVESLRQVSQTRVAAEHFFASFMSWLGRQTRTRPSASFSDTTFRVRQPGGFSDLLTEELKKLGSCVDNIAEKIEREEE